MKTYGILAVAVVVVVLTVAVVHVVENPSDNGNSERIGIIGAMDEEVSALKDAMKQERTETIAGMEYFVGKIGKTNVVVVQCGMGKVNAGLCAHTLINEFNVKKVINTGVAGSLSNMIEIGDFVVSTEAVQHDFDVSPIGFEKGEIPYTGKVAFEADLGMREKMVDSICRSCFGVSVYQGRICTGDQFIETIEQKEAITTTFGGLCCEMEGGAIAQVCYLNNTPFVIIRAISDKVDGSGSVDYEELMKQAAKHSSDAIIYLMENYEL